MPNSARNPTVDPYFTEGCGRCPLGGTPECKVRNWPDELERLRAIVLDCGLTEELKWGVPCYTYQKSNVVIVSALKDCSVLSFFKGALLKDPHRLLEKPGANTRAERVIRFVDVREIEKLEPVLKAYIAEAIEAERAGLKVDYQEDAELRYPAEFQKKLEEDPALKAAFEALTPGRQRAYILYFSAPKQSKTRESRIEKYVQQILDGRGLHD